MISPVTASTTTTPFAGPVVIDTDLVQVLLRLRVAQQNEQGRIGDALHVVSVLRLLERPERLREQHERLAEGNVLVQLLEAIFQLVVLDEVGAAGGDDQIGRQIESDVLFHTPVEENGAANLAPCHAVIDRAPERRALGA